MDVLKQKLQDGGEGFTEKLFKTEDGISGISDLIFVSCDSELWNLPYALKRLHFVYTGKRY